MRQYGGKFKNCLYINIFLPNESGRLQCIIECERIRDGDQIGFLSVQGVIVPHEPQVREFIHLLACVVQIRTKFMKHIRVPKGIGQIG